jgi:hypothetical protein
MFSTQAWFTGPYAPSIMDEDLWADYGDYAEDMWSDAEDEFDQASAESYWYDAAEDAAMEGHLFGWDA